MNADKRAYKTLGNRGLFDMEENKSKPTSLGNPLERLLKAVDFEMFRETLETGLYKKRMTNAGTQRHARGLNMCSGIASRACAGCTAGQWVLHGTRPGTP